MKSKVIILYKFSELSDKAKEKAIQDYREADIYPNWWEFIYEDADIIGLKITSFDDYKVTAKFLSCPYNTAKLILDNHGENCETYTEARLFLVERKKLDDLENEAIDEAIDELEKDFLNSLSEHYRIMLSNEYEYLQSDAYIIENMDANDYYFLESGEIE